MKDFSTQANDCPHFGVCSGCAQIDIYRPPIWEEINRYFREIDLNLNSELFYGKFRESRIKAKLAIEKVNSELHIGLYKERSHEVVDIPECRVHHSSINIAVKLIKQGIEKFDISIYSEKTKQGLLRYLQFFIERKSNKVQLALVLNVDMIEEVNTNRRFFEYLYDEGNLFHSIWVNLNDKDTNVIFSDCWHLFFGENYFWQKIDKIEFLFHPMSFCQSNIDLFEMLIQKMETDEIYFGKEKKNVLELYAGMGAIGLNLADKSNNITFVEKSPFSKMFFEITAKKEGIKNALYLCRDAGEIDSLIEQNEIIIVDPPRKGLDPSVLQKISDKEKGTLIYISCFFKSFKRDSDALLSNLWKLKKADGYLFFPGTNHVEIFAVFEKNLDERI